MLCVSAVAIAGLVGCGGSGGTGGTGGGGGTSKTTPTVTAWPTAGPLGYGQTLASSTLNGGTASVSGAFSWMTPTTAPGAGSQSESVTFTPTDTTDYNSVAGSVTVIVSKAMPGISSWPVASAITYGQTLASSTFSGGATSVPGAFTWFFPTTTPNVGSQSESLTFTPTDVTDYIAVQGSVSVMVNPATPTVSAWPTANAITYGQTLASSTLSGGAASTSGSFAWTTPTLVPSGGIPSESVTFTPADTTDYTTATGSVNLTVNTAAPTVTVTPGSSSITVTSPLSVTVAVSGGVGTATPTGSVVLNGGGFTSAPTTLTSGSAQVAIPASGLTTGTDTLTASYTPDATSSASYKNANGSGQVTVNPAVAYTLTVNSAAPTSGISISPVSPIDNNGASSGITPFTRSYFSGTQVTLSAPLTSGSYSFVSWSGCTTTSGSGGINCTVTISGNTTVTANYNQASVSSITVTPSAATIGTQQQFTAAVHGTGSYSSGVTWSLSCSSCSGLSAGTLSATGLYTTPYPAPASVTVIATSTMSGFTNVSGSATVTLSPPATAAGPALSIDVNTPGTPSENPHTISPYVYGMNGYVLDSASEKTANPGIVRWGGDDTSRYNYQSNMTNSASDYDFENFLGGGGQFPNATGSTNFTQFVQSTDAAGSSTLGTVPVLGWVSNNTQNACGFPETQFPGQQSYSPADCGNGIDPEGTNGCATSGGCDLFGNSTTQAYTSISEPAPSILSAPNPATTTWANGTWSGSWVNSLVTNPSFGNGASGKGVAVWDLDNEPTWWDAVHRDVHPVAFTYDEVTNGGIGTALAIKTADPTALVSGPVIDYWEAYFYSKKDIESGWSSGSPCYQPWSNPIDRESHGGVPMIEYYLQQFKNYSQTYGVRLLDYVDIHGYFAPDYPASTSTSVAFTTAGDTGEQQARMNATRVFWDPTYTDPNDTQPNYITDPNYTSKCSPPAQAPQLIPMLQKWVANDYPGTKTAIDEYNFGGLESINGAVVQADILGIFGRQGLDMGAFWPTTNYNQQGPGNYAFAMYRNYDGNDSAFGNTYLYATSTGTSGDGEGQLAVYGGQRSSDGAVTIMVINKTYGALTSTISLENLTVPNGTTAQVYQYSNANLSAIVQQAGVSVAPPASGTTSAISNYSFPSQSVTLFVVPD
ncbi:MAG TPA: glycoside hydrolase family 44 protein [Terracidiphilus sp.]